MRLVQVEMPASYINDYTQQEIDYDLDKLAGADIVVYWYGAGSYEGSGQLVARKDGLWFYESLSHCSCYGPPENFKFKNGRGLIEDWRGTDDWMGDLSAVISKAKELEDGEK